MSEDIKNRLLPKDILREHLDAKGIKRVWLSQQFGKDPSWAFKVLDGTVKIHGDLKTRLEELLNIKF